MCIVGGGGWELAASNKSAGRGQCGHANYSSPSTAGPKQETHLIHWKNAQRHSRRLLARNVWSKYCCLFGLRNGQELTCYSENCHRQMSLATCHICHAFYCFFALFLLCLFCLCFLLFSIANKCEQYHQQSTLSTNSNIVKISSHFTFIMSICYIFPDVPCSIS